MLAVRDAPAVSASDVDRLEAAFLQEPQADCPVVHKFAPGLYIREVTLPTGACVIGHRHKSAHYNVMLSGRLTLIDPDGDHRELTAPYSFTSGPGRKIAYIHETVVWQNVYATGETDVQVLEDTLLDKSDAWRDAEVQRQARFLPARAETDDYEAVLRELNLDPEIVRQIVENPLDQIPFPLGEYSVMVDASPIHGKGLFATAPMEPNTLIAPVRLNGKRTPAERYANHSPTPNAEMARSGLGDIYLFSTAYICGSKGGLPGDEITIDYRHALRLTMKETALWLP